jgi:hypothetical protein
LNRIYSTNYVAVGSETSWVQRFGRADFPRTNLKGRSDHDYGQGNDSLFYDDSRSLALVLQAGALGKGGEIFHSRYGQTRKILDLAEDMIRLSGLQPYEDIDIVFTGMRQGEKLFEELEITGENLLKTTHPKIFIGKIATYSGEEVGNIVSNFRQAVEENNAAKIRRLLNHFLPEAKISEDKQKMLAAKAAAI